MLIKSINLSRVVCFIIQIMIVSEQRRVHIDRRGCPQKIEVLKVLRKPDADPSHLHLPQSYTPIQHPHPQKQIQYSHHNNKAFITNQQVILPTTRNIIVALALAAILILFIFTNEEKQKQSINSTATSRIQRMQDKKYRASHQNIESVVDLYKTDIIENGQQVYMPIRSYLSQYLSSAFEGNQTYSQSYISYMRKQIQAKTAEQLLQRMQCKHWKSGQLICKFQE